MERIFMNCNKLIKFLDKPTLSPNANDFEEFENSFKQFDIFLSLSNYFKVNSFLKYLINFIKIEKYPKNSIIYKKNLKADKIYILLLGKVITNDSELESSQKNKSLVEDQIKLTNLQKSLIEGPVSLMGPLKNPDESEENTQSNYELLEKISEKNSFSGLNLNMFDNFHYCEIKISETFGSEFFQRLQLRQFNCISKTASVVLSITVKGIKCTALKIKEQVNEEIKNFLFNLEFFSSWSKSSLSKIVSYFTLEKVYKNQYLFRVGDTPKFVYFIKSGEFTIFQALKIEKFPKKPSNLEEFSVTQRTLHKFSKNKSKERNFPIMIKGENEILGAEEIIFGLSTRNFSCMSNSEFSLVAKVSKDVFLGKIMYPDAIEKMKFNLKCNFEWINERISGIEKLENFQFRPDTKHSNDKEKMNRTIKLEKRNIKELSEKIKTISTNDESPIQIRDVKAHSTMKVRKNRIIRKNQSPQIDLFKKFAYVQKKEPPPNFLIKFRETISERRKSQEIPTVCYTLP